MAEIQYWIITAFHSPISLVKIILLFCSLSLCSCGTVTQIPPGVDNTETETSANTGYPILSEATGIPYYPAPVEVTSIPYIPPPTEPPADSFPTSAPSSTPALPPIRTPRPTIYVKPDVSYTNSMGVSITLPDGGNIEILSENDQLIIAAIPPYARFETYRRLAAEFIDPHTWSPNEGGYEMIWERAIEVNGMSGFQFVWGPPRDPMISYEVYVILYNPENSLEIRVLTGFDKDLKDELGTPEFPALFKARYERLDKIVSSIHIGD
jgi:hypothetical protein